MPELVSVHESETLCDAGATPVPFRLWAGAFEALLVTERTALAAPEVAGENVRVTGTLCPAAIVMGKAIPVSENSVLLMLADETVTQIGRASCRERSVDLGGRRIIKKKNKSSDEKRSRAMTMGAAVASGTAPEGLC